MNAGDTTSGDTPASAAPEATNRGKAKRFGRAFLFRAVVATLLLGMFGTYIAWTESPEVRYRKYYNRMHSMIFNEKGPVDLAIMGSSRTQCMVGAKYWSRELFGSDSNQRVVYNLATSQRGKGFHYVVLRDLMEHRKVNHIVLDMIDTDKRDDFYMHPWFYVVARHRDIFRSVMLDTGRPWHQRIRFGLQVLLKKHATILDDYLLKRLALAPTPPPVEAKTKDHLSANPIRPTNIAKIMGGTDWDAVKPSVSWDFDAPLEQRNTNFIREIVELARANGVRVDFVFVPQLMKPSLSDDMVVEIKERFGGTVLQPVPDHFRGFFPAAFADAGHGSEKGRDIFARMVMPKLRAVQ